MESVNKQQFEEALEMLFEYAHQIHQEGDDNYRFVKGDLANAMGRINIQKAMQIRGKVSSVSVPAVAAMHTPTPSKPKPQFGSVPPQLPGKPLSGMAAAVPLAKEQPVFAPAGSKGAQDPNKVKADIPEGKEIQEDIPPAPITEEVIAKQTIEAAATEEEKSAQENIAVDEPPAKEEVARMEAAENSGRVQEVDTSKELLTTLAGMTTQKVCKDFGESLDEFLELFEIPVQEDWKKMQKAAAIRQHAKSKI